MSDYLNFKGTPLANKIYSEYQAELKPAFQKMLGRGYTDVTFVHTRGSSTDFLSEDWAHHRGNFIFTLPKKNYFALISQLDKIDSSGYSIPADPEEVGTFNLRYLGKVLSNAYNSPIFKAVAPYYQIKECSDAADLALVLQEGNFDVPPSSPDAISVRRMVHPITTRISRVLHMGYKRSHRGGNKETEHVATR